MIFPKTKKRILMLLKLVKYKQLEILLRKVDDRYMLKRDRMEQPLQLDVLSLMDEHKHHQ